MFSTQDGVTMWNKFSQTLQEAIHFAVPKKSVIKHKRSLWKTDRVRLARSLCNKAE